MRWCSHCDVDRARRRDGVCDACNAYRSKYGRLPPAGVVRRRLERREERRLATMRDVAARFVYNSSQSGRSVG